MTGASDTLLMKRVPLTNKPADDAVYEDKILPSGAIMDLPDDREMVRQE
jgi:hypothetical protein